MVTAIMIPVLILYFYWIAKKELIKQKSKWKTLEDIKLEARIEGVILNISPKKKRFYHQYYMMVTTIQLQDRQRLFTVVHKQPLTAEWKPIPMIQGDQVVVLGHWEKDTFIAGKIKKDAQKSL
jgi:hypothetical protein